MTADPRRPDTAFWVEAGAVEADHLRLDSGESHHLLRVHRAPIGAPFEAVDGMGTLYSCVLEGVRRHEAVGRIVERRSRAGELPGAIQLLLGLPDAGAVEAAIEHATPLGVSVFDLVAADRSGRRPYGPERLARLSRIARSGLKQCRRSLMPAIRSSPSLASAVAVLSPGARFFADPAGTPWASGGLESPEPNISLAVGPPGGFSDRELVGLREAGFRPISLGPSRLTTETAALSLVASARNCLLINDLSGI